MNKVKIAFYGIIVLAILGAGGALYSYIFGLKSDNKRLYTNLVGEEQKYQQLNQYVAKLQVDYKSQDDLKKQAETIFQTQIADLQGRIKVLTDSSFEVDGPERDTKTSDVEQNGSQTSEIKLQDGPPLGFVTLNKDGSVDSDVYKFQFKVESAISQDEKTGKYSVLNKAFYILEETPKDPQSFKWQGLAYPLTITSGVATIDPTQPIMTQKSFYWLNPRGSIGVNADMQGLYPTFGVSVASYGLSKTDSDFKFLELGLQSDNSRIDPVLVPVLWRPLPSFLANTYVGPGVGYYNSETRFFLTLQLGL